MYSPIKKTIHIEREKWGTGNDLITLIDTNVINYMKGEGQSEIKAFLEKFQFFTQKVNCEPILAFSTVSLFEIYQNKNFEKNTTIDQIWVDYNCIEPSPDIFFLAAKVKKYLEAKGVTFGKNYLPDLLIASTAVYFWAGILTANQNEFSPHIFKEIDSFTITYKDKNNRTQNRTIYHLLPDSEKIDVSLKQFLTD